jgi:RHS repeat-associated protein
LEVTENGMITKYQPNDANQYAKIAHGTEVIEPEYDPEGNLLHDATRKYTWDADIHLTAVSTQTGQPGTKNPEQRTEFKYDPLHRRIARVKDSGEVTLYVYEGWNVVSEKTTPKAPQLDTENFKLETRYTWGEDLSGSLQGAGGIGGLLSSTLEQSPTKNEAQRTTNCFHYDSNGNIILLTDAQANETARYSYDAFGKTLTAIGPAAGQNRYQFSTKPVEEESGLVYYGYRWYDPVTGRWPSRDPIGEIGGINRYGFLANNANVDVDVLGFFGAAIQIPAAVAAAAASGMTATQIAEVFGVSVAVAALAIQCHQLGKQKREAIDNSEGLGGCNGGMTCTELRLRAYWWKLNATFRWNYDQICWAGGDDGHIEAQQKAYDVWKNCELLMSQKNCSCVFE